MCLSAILAAAVTAAPYVGAAATLHGIDQSRKQANTQADRAREAQATVDTTATQNANARLAQRRRALSANSLVTDQSSSGMASAGRVTLGGG